MSRGIVANPRSDCSVLFQGPGVAASGTFSLQVMSCVTPGEEETTTAGAQIGFYKLFAVVEICLSNRMISVPPLEKKPSFDYKVVP